LGRYSATTGKEGMCPQAPCQPEVELLSVNLY
jgi:hypothetical protein